MHLKHEFFRAAATSHEASAKRRNRGVAAMLLHHLSEHSRHREDGRALFLSQRLQRLLRIERGRGVHYAGAVTQGAEIAHYHAETVVHARA